MSLSSFDLFKWPDPSIQELKRFCWHHLMTMVGELNQYDEAKLKQVQKALGPNASVSELKPYLKDVKGLKVNDPVVTIAFR